MSNRSNRSRFVRRRHELGLTQKRIAEALEVSTRTINNWEQGKSEPRLTIRQTAVLCGLLECSVTELARDFEEIPLKPTHKKKGKAATSPNS